MQVADLGQKLPTLLSKRCVILLTVFRRYHELSRTITRIHELKEEFVLPPEIVVVWAQPEVSRLWFFEELQQTGKIQHLLGRPKLPGEREGGSTTYPESHNLRLGLEFVRRTFPAHETYVIGQAGDILPQPDHCYRYLDSHIQNGEQAVVLHWSNGCCTADVWHTNLFAVPLDEAYWPPVADPDSPDVLERMWGRQLTERQLPGVVRNHNSNNKRFVHAHLSEQLESWPERTVFADVGLTLSVCGYLPWWRRLFMWFLRRVGVSVRERVFPHEQDRY